MSSTVTIAGLLLERPRDGGRLKDMKHVRVAVVALAATLALAACGEAGNEPGSPSASASPTASPSPPPLDPVPTMPAKPSRATALTLSGTVMPGVEPNCLLLDKYLLVGGDRAVLKAGAKVTVTGRADPDLLTTCQQGTPFQVETVRPG
jgi:hypothetical protein